MRFVQAQRMIQKTEFGYTGSITDLPAWGTNPEMGFVAALVAINQMKTNTWCKGMSLPDGSHSGCSCDCPACEEAAKKLAKLEPYLTISDMALAGVMYTAYCEAVGGVAYDGKPLPKWEEFSTDPTKKKQTLGWMAAARVARPHDPAS